MKTESRKPFPTAMAFYHNDGLPAAWHQAAKFAENNGRLATMPDIIAARLATKPEDFPWQTYFTTTSAEYYGIGKNGKRILIVAHGVGPMSTLDGIQKAYKWEYSDKEREKRGGRITAQEFSDLEDGKFGEVEIIDLESYCERYKYPFLQMLLFSEAMSDPVLKARIGPSAEKYIQLHAEITRTWHREEVGSDEVKKPYLTKDVVNGVLSGKKFYNGNLQHVLDGANDSNPYIIKVDGASNCSYFFGKKHGFRQIEEGYAIGHLLSIGTPCNVCHEGNSSLASDISCHEWYDGVRLVGIKPNGNFSTGIHKGPSAEDLLRKHWRDLFVATRKRETPDFQAMMMFDDQWFTQYEKTGECMDTHKPKHLIISAEKIGEPVQFKTTIGGWHGFFKYGINEVKAIAPPNANAYFFVSDTQIVWENNNPTHHVRMVQFFKIDVDMTKRLIQPNRLAYKYETLMQLLEKEMA